MEGQGGNGVYTYFWEGQQIAGPVAGSATFEISHANGGASGTGRVQSGDGQATETILFVSPPACAN